MSDHLPSGAAGTPFPAHHLLSLKGAGEKGWDATWKLSQRCVKSSPLCYFLLTTSIGVPKGSWHWLQAACCALARLLPPWHGAPGCHNVPFLCWGQRYGAAWQEDSTFSSCLLPGCVPQSTVGIRKCLELETDFWVCAVPGKLRPASV